MRLERDGPTALHVWDGRRNELIWIWRLIQRPSQATNFNVGHWGVIYLQGGKNPLIIRVDQSSRILSALPSNLFLHIYISYLQTRMLNAISQEKKHHFLFFLYTLSPIYTVLTPIYSLIMKEKQNCWSGNKTPGFSSKPGARSRTTFRTFWKSWLYIQSFPFLGQGCGLSNNRKGYGRGKSLVMPFHHVCAICEWNVLLIVINFLTLQASMIL